MDDAAVVHIQCHEAAPPDPAGTEPQHRQWAVSLRVRYAATPRRGSSGSNSGSRPSAVTRSATLRDPLTLAQYESVLDRYLRDSDRPPRPSTRQDERDMDDVRGRAEHHIAVYAAELWGQVAAALPSSSAASYHLYVRETHDDARWGAGGIHCLAWELLEGMADGPRVRVTRVGEFTGEAFSVPQPLAAAGRHVRVLLVVARDLGKVGGGRDAEPDLAQVPLMTVQRRLRGRMLLEVVRPGSREDLEEHLALRTRQGIVFHIVHFDLHGRIQKDETGTLAPFLLFARRHRKGTAADMPQTQLAPAASVADLLAQHRVENVVLNACLSAYNRHGPGTNLAQLLLRRGIRNVSGMWYYVHWQTVTTYLEAFYVELLVRGADFHTAAQRARQAVRLHPTTRAGAAYHDFFLNVNYTRQGARRGLTAEGSGGLGRPRREFGRSASSSHDSASSDSGADVMIPTTGTSGRRWKAHSPRLSDGLVANLPSSVGGGSDRPMHMQLHLLDLEYKLTALHVVYASDLRRRDSHAGATLAQTLDGLIDMWLGTNLVDEVLFYRGKDLGRRRSANPQPHDRRMRPSLSSPSPSPAGGSSPSHSPTSSVSSLAGHGLGIGQHSPSHSHSHSHAASTPLLQQLLTTPSPPSVSSYLSSTGRATNSVRALGGTLHVVRDIDGVVDPGIQADEEDNRRDEARRRAAEANLLTLAERVHSSTTGGDARQSYLLLVGSQDDRWWRTYLAQLGGEWWLHMPWGVTVHDRFNREMRLPHEGRRSLTPSPLGMR